MRIGDYTPFACTDPSCPMGLVTGSHVGFFVVAEWSSAANSGDPAITYPKFVWVDLARTGDIVSALGPVSTAYWNWPIYDSMFWPGAEIAVVSADAASSCANVSLPELGLYGSWTNYSVDLTDLFTCVSDELNLFQSSMPAGDINITGVHFFTEAANATSGEIEILIRNVRVD